MDAACASKFSAPCALLSLSYIDIPCVHEVWNLGNGDDAACLFGNLTPTYPDRHPRHRLLVRFYISKGKTLLAISCLSTGSNLCSIIYLGKCARGPRLRLLVRIYMSKGKMFLTMSYVSTESDTCLTSPWTTGLKL